MSAFDNIIIDINVINVNKLTCGVFNINVHKGDMYICQIKKQKKSLLINSDL